MNVEFSGLPIAVVIEGKIQHKNLKLMNKSEQWLQKELKDKGFNRIKEIFYASVKNHDYSLTVITNEGKNHP
jgi:uncharacterized membrane protein YcaP (DUF421 family)